MGGREAHPFGTEKPELEGGTVRHGDHLDPGAEVDHDLELEALCGESLGHQKAVLEEPEVARLLARGVDAEVDEFAMPHELSRAFQEELGFRLEHLVQLLRVRHDPPPLCSRHHPTRFALSWMERLTFAWVGVSVGEWLSLTTPPSTPPPPSSNKPPFPESGLRAWSPL